jgi:hypothetical protein
MADLQGPGHDRWSWRRQDHHRASRIAATWLSARASPIRCSTHGRALSAGQRDSAHSRSQGHQPSAVRSNGPRCQVHGRGDRHGSWRSTRRAAASNAATTTRSTATCWWYNRRKRWFSCGRILPLVHTDLNEGGLDAKPLRDDICIKAKSALYLVRYATLSAITPCSPTSILVTPVSPIRGASRQNCRRKHWLPGVRSVRSTGLHVPLYC